MAKLKAIRLEEALLEEGLISQADLNSAIAQLADTDKGLEQILVESGAIDGKKLVEIKGRVLGLRVIDLSSFPIPAEAATSIPEALAREHRLIPVVKREGTITLAMADPLDIDAIDAVERHSGCRVETVLSSESDIRDAIRTFFGVFGQIKGLLERTARDRLEMESESAEKTDLDVASLEGPIAQIVNLIITQAVSVRASDIHLEPLENRLRVRFRVDGLLQEVLSFEKIYQAALASSAKIMCAMDIAEKRIPQDGRFRVRVNDRNIDLRASTFPTMHGEKFVFRILDKESANIHLSQLGIRDEEFEKLSKVIKQPHGLFLVTGPTGSGKTTTLYSVLKEVNTPRVNILTMEDPVEFDLDTVNQGQVNVKSGLTFAKGLRAMLRQDPDIVMIGEIRDNETAEIATQAALTGHLVLSTLHTNSAPGAIARLTDMDVEPFLVASSLAGVLAQRLVRRLCQKCKKPYKPQKEMLQRLGLLDDFDFEFYKPVGCRDCGRTGYRGRAGIYELMFPTEAIRSMIIARKSTGELREQAIRDGMLTLQMDGIEKANAGISSIEEIMRVAGGE